MSPSLSPSLSSGNLSEGCSRRLSKVFRAKSTAKLLGPLSCSPCAGRTGEHKHGRFQVGFSHCRQRPARLRKICYHSCDTDSVQESTRFSCFVDIWQRYKFLGHDESHIFFSCEMKILMEVARSRCKLDQSSAHCFAQSFYQSLVSD